VIGGAILAAGEGRRFGGRKQLAELGGHPLLEYAVRAMLAVPAIERLVFVLGAHADEVRTGVDFGSAEPVECPDWHEGMAASLRCALQRQGDADALVVTLGDQPGITPAAIGAVIEALDGPHAAVRATYDGVPGHPVAFKRQLFAALLALRGEAGARDLLAGTDVLEVECDRLARGDDVDTPAQLDALRAGANAAAGGWPLD